MYPNANPFSSVPFGGARIPSNVYRRVGVETSVSTASPHDLVKLLFEGYFEAIAQAKGGIQTNDIALKAKGISKAVAIIDEGLKACLDMKQGGQLSTNLWNLYEYVSLRLTQANLKNDLALLDECVQLITPIRDSWVQISSQANTANVRQEVAA
jgi:flagellar secretion chaperone FliS